MSRPFLVTFVGRSGSTALMLDLEQHPMTMAHMELFGAPLLHKGLPPTDENRLDLLREIWGGYLARPGRRPKETRATGFKFQFKRSGPQFGDHAALAEGLKPYHPVVIALWRRDLLRQAISTLRSRALEAINEREIGLAIPHLVAESGPRARAFAERPMRLDLAELAAEVEAVQANVADMRAFLARCPAQLMISYETYLANRKGVLNRVVDALGLEPFEAPPPQKIGKITGSDLSQAIENWEVVRKWAQETGLLTDGDGPESRRRDLDASGGHDADERRLRRRVAEIRRSIALLEDEAKALHVERRSLKQALAAHAAAAAAT